MTEPTASKASRKHQTRRRLIDSAIQLLREDNVAALTTVRITRGAGIAQSSFYEHFKNVDECLHAVADLLEEQLTSRLNEFRRGAYAKQTTPEQFYSRETTKSMYADSFAIFDDQRGLAEVLLRYRRDNGPLGEALRGVLSRARDGAVDDLVAALDSLGIHSNRVELELLTEVTTTLALYGAEQILDGRDVDRERLVRRLASATRGMFRGMLLDATGRAEPSS